MQQTIREALIHAKTVLQRTVDNATLEAELLLAHVLHVSRPYLHTHQAQSLEADAAKQFNDFLNRRVGGEPLAYITGTREFWSFDLAVTQDTLIPRPETETLIETVLSLFPDKNQSLTLADLGTGSGAIAIALASERHKWQIFATDVSEKALAIASKNAQSFAPRRISFCLGNWCTALPPIQFDVIVSNPPYITEVEWDDYAEGLLYEPQTALVSGPDGLDAIKDIMQQAGHYLAPGGYLVFEHGFQQGEAVRQLFASRKYSKIQTVRDLANRERVTIGCFQKE